LIFGAFKCDVSPPNLKINSRRNKMDLTSVAFNTADVLAVGVLVLGATAVIWGIKKAIGMAK